MPGTFKERLYHLWMVFRHRLALPFAFLGMFSNTALGSFARLVGTIAAAPFRLIWAIRVWWSQRHIRQLAVSMPAIIAILGSAYFVFASSFRIRTSATGDYLVAARSALGRENYRDAKLLFEKALQLRPNDNEALFDLARAAREVGDYPRVAAIMQTLAPLDKPVHAEAHLWMASFYMAQPEKTAENYSNAEKHLRYASQLRPQEQRTRIMLGTVFYEQDLFESAIEQLSNVVEAYPSYKLMLARAYAQRGDQVRARRLGEQALGYWSDRRRQDPLDVNNLLNWADANVFLERFSEAATALIVELKRQDDPAVRKVLGQIYLGWAEFLDTSQASERQRAFEYQSLALISNPDELMVYDRMLRLIMKDGVLAESARNMLENNIAEGKARVVSHLILGALDVEEKRTEQAKFHIETAMKELPGAPIILNNLAWVLAVSDPPDIDRGMALVNKALEETRNDPRVLDTRGHIFLLQKKYREAISDLEKGLHVHRENPETHQALSEAYKGLGLMEMSERHAQLFRKYSKSAKANAF